MSKLDWRDVRKGLWVHMACILYLSALDQFQELRDKLTAATPVYPERLLTVSMSGNASCKISEAHQLANIVKAILDF